jgi:predicted nucleic acid-binding Zn ribbon protein
MEEEEKRNSLFNSRCWKCKTVLVLKRLHDGSRGLYCTRCCRFRKLKVKLPVATEGCEWSRVDVRRSGKHKRKIYLNEIIE